MEPIFSTLFIECDSFNDNDYSWNKYLFEKPKQTQSNVLDLDTYSFCLKQMVFYLQDGAHYMIYTPADPLLFVAVKVIFLISLIAFFFLSLIF